MRAWRPTPRVPGGAVVSHSNPTLLREALAALAVAGPSPAAGQGAHPRRLAGPADAHAGQVREWVSGSQPGAAHRACVLRAGHRPRPRHDDGTPLPELPRTVTVNTGGGGTHRYYRCPGDLPPNSNGKIHRALDVKSLGGQAVFVGSVHPDTRRMYAWAPGLDPDSVPLAEVPAELLARMRAEKERPVPAAAVAHPVLLAPTNGSAAPAPTWRGCRRRVGEHGSRRASGPPAS